jgi:hypothetical protein
MHVQQERNGGGDDSIRERRDHERTAVVENLEVVLRQIGDQVSVAIPDRRVDGDRLDAGLEIG